MPRLLMILLLVAWAAASMAQPDPGANQPVKPNPPIPAIAQPMMPSPNSVAMEGTAEGLFVAAGGVLAKYDPRTLEPRGKAELLPPLARPPVDAQNNAEMWRYNLEVQKRNTPPGLLPAGPSIIVVFGDQVFQVNQRTMQIEMKVDLSDPRMPMNYYGPAPIMKPSGDLLYIIRFPHIVSVDMKAGKILGRTTVPGINIPQPIAQPINQPNPPGRQPEGDAQLMVLIGTLKQVNLEGGFWAVRDEQGAEYVLQGEKLRELVALPQANGTRVRIQGTLKQGAGVAQYGKGYLTIVRYEVLK